MGYNVVTLDDVDLTPEKLKGVDAVVIGVRAYNVRPHSRRRAAGLVQLRGKRRNCRGVIQPAR